MSTDTDARWPDQLPELATVGPELVEFDDKRKTAFVRLRHTPHATNVNGVFAAAAALKELRFVSNAEPVFKPDTTGLQLQLSGDATYNGLIDFEVKRLLERIGPRVVFDGDLKLTSVVIHRVNGLQYGQTLSLAANASDSKKVFDEIGNEFLEALSQLRGVVWNSEDEIFDGYTLVIPVEAKLTRKKAEELAGQIATLLNCRLDTSTTKYENADREADLHAEGLAKALRTLLNDPDAVHSLEDEEAEEALTDREHVGV